MMELMAEWKPEALTKSGRGTPTATDIKLHPTDWITTWGQLEPIVRDIIRRANNGTSCRVADRRSSAVVIPTSTPIGKQIAEAREIVMKKGNPNATLKDGTKGRKCNQKQLNKHLAVISKIGQVLVDNKKSLSVESAARVLLQTNQRDGKYTIEQVRASKLYKDELDIVKFACREMGLPMQMPNEVVPTWKSKPKDRLIPSDATLCKRFKAIKDPYEQKLLYACVAFGRRNREIYSMDYDNIQKKDGITMMYVYSNKTKSNGITWCLPFGDEQVDLSGFEPPEWETLKTIDHEADESLESMYATQSAKITELCKDRLGCYPCDLRHRWCCKALIDGNNEFHVAEAMGTSPEMIRKTYARQIAQGKMKKGWTPQVS